MLRRAPLLILLIAGFQLCLGQTLYTITEIVPPRSYDESMAVGINNGGQVLLNLNGIGSAAAVYGQGSVRILPDPGTEQFYLATDINDSGQVVGFTQGGRKVLLWEPGATEPALLPTFGPSQNRANAINNHGVIVGLSDSRAVMWKNGVITALGLPGTSIADGVNDDGYIVGRGSSGIPSFIWKDGTWEILGIFPIALNEQPFVVGFNSRTSTAVVWDDGHIMDLGTLGGQQSACIDVNEAGDVVGRAGTTTGIAAFLWKRTPAFPDGRLQNLNLLIPQGTGWHLEFATGINDAGQICGIGQRNGRTRAFMLNPIRRR